MIIVRANARNATYISDDLITSGSVGIPVTFNLSEDFDGLSAIVVFEGSGTARDVALMGNTCVVPHEVLATAGGYLRIGIYASNSAGTIVIPTVWAGSKMILQGTEPSEVDPSEPTPSWVAQVQAAAAEALENSEEAIEIAGGAAAAAEDARQSASAAATSATAAEQSASAAGASQTAAEAAAGAATSARDAAVAAQSGAENNAQAAAGSATAAAGSAAAAAASEAAAREVQESIPADYTALSEDVSDLKSQIIPNILFPIPASGGREPGYVDIDTGVSWEVGTIDPSTGQPADNGNCMRTADYILFDSSISQIHVAYASENIKAFIVWYNSSFERTGTSGDISSIIPYDFSNPVSATRLYWKIVIQYTNGSSPDATLPTLLKLQYYDPGEPGGNVDRTNDIEDILIEYGECVLSKGDFYVTGIDMPVGSKLLGQGLSTRLFLMSSVQDGAAITPLGDNTISDMTIILENGHTSRPSSSSPGTIHGIKCANNVNLIRINNCDISGFTGAGLYGYGEIHNNCMSVVACNCRFLFNTIGIWCYSGMEYNSIVNCVCNSNNIGIRNEGGNNLFSNCHVDANSSGYLQNTNGISGGNFGHSSLVGCTFNHNTSYSVYIQGGDNGLIFSACQLWYGGIYIRNVKAIVFDACEIGGTTIPITFYGSSCKGNRYMDCSFSTQPTVTLANSAATDAYIMKDCYLWDGTAVSF